MSVNHPGMSRQFYEAALRRAAKAQLRCLPVVGMDDAYLVDSTKGRSAYLVVLGTTQSCRCEGHDRHARCVHRAVAIEYAARSNLSAEAKAA